MLALIHLEYRRLIPMLRLVALLLVAGLVPGLINPNDGVVGLAFAAICVMLLIIRIFPVGPAEDQANRLVSTLPTSRRQVVSARYLLVIGLVALLAGILVVVLLLQPGDSFGGRFGVASMFMIAPLLNLVVTGPLSTRGGLGAVGPAIPRVIFAALILTVILLPEAVQQRAMAAVTESPAVSLGVGGASLAVLLVLSYLLSVRLFERRDL